MAKQTAEHAVPDLNLDLEEWVRQAESSAQDFKKKKEQLAPFRTAGWRDNGPTHLSYYKRFRSKEGTEYQSSVWLDDDGFLRWQNRGGATDLDMQKVSLADAEKIIRLVAELEKRVTSLA